MMVVAKGMAIVVNFTTRELQSIVEAPVVQSICTECIRSWHPMPVLANASFMYTCQCAGRAKLQLASHAIYCFYIARVQGNCSLVSLRKMQTERLLLEADSSMRLWLQARPSSFPKVSSYLHGFSWIAPECAGLVWQSITVHDSVVAGYQCHVHQ